MIHMGPSILLNKKILTISFSILRNGRRKVAKMIIINVKQITLSYI